MKTLGFQSFLWTPQQAARNSID